MKNPVKRKRTTTRVRERDQKITPKKADPVNEIETEQDDDRENERIRDHHDTNEQRYEGNSNEEDTEERE